MDYILYKGIAKDLSPSVPLSQFNQSREGIVDGPIVRHDQSCGDDRVDRNVTNYEARKLNLYSMTEGAILQHPNLFLQLFQEARAK